MRILYDGPHIQVLKRRGSSRYVLVTFNELGSRANGADIWAQSIADRLDLHAIGFVTKEPNWFPAEDLASACAAAQRALRRFDRRIGYGFSQGGYAAIKASAPLGLTHTIAVSPQYSIDPGDVEDRRFTPHFRTDLNAGMRIAAADAPQSLYIFYDRDLSPDREHVDRIVAAIPAARAHHMPSTEHETIRAFTGSARFPELIAAIVAGTPEATVSRMRRDSMVRKVILTKRAIRTGRLETALGILATAGITGVRRSLLIADFASAGAAERVLPLAEADHRAAPDDHAGNAAFALVLASVGRSHEARDRLAAARRAPLPSRVCRVADAAEHVLTQPERLLVQARPAVISSAPVPPPSSDAAPPSRRTGLWSGLLSRTRRRPG